MEAVVDQGSIEGSAAPGRSRRVGALHWSASTWAAALIGIAIAGIAIALRLMLSSATGGEQTIFSFPAIVAATLLFGMRAGGATTLICLLAWWYFILPPVHSFALAGPAQAISILIYVFVAAALIWAIGGLRLALARANMLTGLLEQAVARRTAERDRLWEGSREFVALLDRHGLLQATNPVLTHAIGAGSRPQSGRFADLIVPADRAQSDAALQQLTGDGTSVSFEGRLLSSAGERWVDWTAKCELGQVYLVGHDVTAEHDCSETLRQSRKMEFVGQMTGGLVHDFANLLSPITMVLDMLRQRHPTDSRTAGLIEAAQQSTGRAEMLVRRLLRFSRSDGMEARPLPASVLVEQAGALLRQVVGQRVLDIVAEPDLPDIRVDANEFDLALLNLVVNARDATAEDGHIRISAVRAGESVAITVADDGIGMDAATLQRAREPFFTTKGPDRGTGLGLPMVFNFATGAGGSVELTSMAGQGTTVRLVLPGADMVVRDGTAAGSADR